MALRVVYRDYRRILNIKRGDVMFSINSWAKVWKIEAHEKFTKIQCSTQTKKDGNYITDFSSYVTLVGEAHKKAVDLTENSRIKILNFGVTTSNYNGKYYTNITVFDFELKEQNSSETNESLPFS